MNKILVTGSTGLLGSSLVPYLRACGHTVITHANEKSADFVFDLSEKKKSYELLNKIEPDCIINLASLTGVELCEDYVNLAYLANTATVENISNWIESRGVGCHLVHISTDHVYDGVGEQIESNVKITNNYAFSKYAGELAAIRVPSTILRTTFVGRSTVSYRESLTDWVYNSLSSNKNVQVLSDVLFSPLSIKVLLEMIELVVRLRPIGIYNLGSRGGMSKADFDFAFAECLKFSTSNMERIESSRATFLRAYRPKDMRMNSTKFETRMGVQLPNLSSLIEKIALEYIDVN